jgi:hypothetical protein
LPKHSLHLPFISHSLQGKVHPYKNKIIKIKKKSLNNELNELILIRTKKKFNKLNIYKF